jgi:hypothetical protein
MATGLPPTVLAQTSRSVNIRTNAAMGGDAVDPLEPESWVRTFNPDPLGAKKQEILCTTPRD